MSNYGGLSLDLRPANVYGTVSAANVLVHNTHFECLTVLDSHTLADRVNSISIQVVNYRCAPKADFERDVFYPSEMVTASYLKSANIFLRPWAYVGNCSPLSKNPQWPVWTQLSGIPWGRSPMPLILIEFRPNFTEKLHTQLCPWTVPCWQ